MNLNTVQEKIKKTFAQFGNQDNFTNTVQVLSVEDSVRLLATNLNDFYALRNLVFACADQIGTYQQKNRVDVLNEVEVVMLKKNLDYGSSFLIPLVFLPNEKPELTILVRLSDKVERYRNLIQQNRVINVVDESIEDTLKDIIGYCVLLVVARQFNQEDT